METFSALLALCGGNSPATQVVDIWLGDWQITPKSIYFLAQTKLWCVRGCVYTSINASLLLLTLWPNLKLFIINVHRMMTSSNGNIFHVTDPLCGEFTGPRWIPRTKASDAELWFSFICAWIIGWVNNREAGDLRRYHANYDVIVMASMRLHGFMDIFSRTAQY